jgi:CRP-like cAMP-binding protein
MVPIESLKSNSFFSGFSDEQLKEMAAVAAEESCRAGFQVYKKGDPANKFYLLVEGKIIMIMEVDVGAMKPPLQVTVDFVTRGDAMGWSSVVEPHAYTLGARCIEDSKMIAFDAAKLRGLLREDVALGFKFMQETAKVIATRLTHTQIVLVGERGLAVLTEY